MKPLISNIQRFSVHDGPGIRTTVFFKGCSLHCPWCANPENISCENEFYKLGDKKIFWGEYIDESTLYEKVTLDKAFYGKEGGVTFSGGEPLLFLKYYENLLRRIREEEITIGIETALFVPRENIFRLSEYIDFYFVDLKILTRKKCKDILGGNLDVFMENLASLHQVVSKEKIIYRLPFVPNITDTDENLEQICKILENYPSNHVEIFSVHNLGKRKYELLGKRMQEFEILTQRQLGQIKKRIERYGVEVIINNI